MTAHVDRVHVDTAHVDSHYLRTREETREHPRLDGDLDVNVAVVGGGLAGTNTAIDLARRGLRVALIEARRVGWGASGRNGGFATEGFPGGYPALAARVGLERAREFLAVARRGLQLTLGRISEFAIRCGPLQAGALQCGLRGGGDALLRYRDTMARDFDVAYEHWPEGRLREALSSPLYADALFLPATVAVQPLDLACGMARACAEAGVQVFEMTPALGLSTRGDRKVVRTPGGRITAAHVVIACGGYVHGLHARLAGATVPIATFVMATEPLGDRLAQAIRVPYAIFDDTVAVNYYRPLPDTRLLWGGRVLAWQPDPARIRERLRRDMARFYPALAGARVAVAWGGMMPFTRHKLPVVGQVEPGVWYATGFGGLGVTLTAAAGELIARGIAEGDEGWRLFESFGLPFAGGRLGKVPAQMVYWTHQARAALRQFAVH